MRVIIRGQAKHLSVSVGARVAAILNRGRAITLPMISGLTRLLDIPADVLIQPYEILGPHDRELAADAA